LGFKKVESMCSSVDLPLPLTPTTAIDSCLFKVKWTSSNRGYSYECDIAAALAAAMYQEVSSAN